VTIVPEMVPNRIIDLPTQSACPKKNRIQVSMIDDVSIQSKLPTPFPFLHGRQVMRNELKKSNIRLPKHESRSYIQQYMFSYQRVSNLETFRRTVVRNKYPPQVFFDQVGSLTGIRSCQPMSSAATLVADSRALIGALP
jgi:hypothetical protein